MSSNDDVKYITKELVLANLRKSFPKTLLQQYSYPIIRLNKSLPTSLNDSSFTISSSDLAKSLTPHNKVDEKQKLEHLIHGNKKSKQSRPGIVGTFGLFVFLLALLRMNWFKDLIEGYDDDSNDDSSSSDSSNDDPPPSQNQENKVMTKVRNFDCSFYSTNIDTDGNSKKNLNQRFYNQQKDKEFWVWPYLLANNLGEKLRLPSFNVLLYEPRDPFDGGQEGIVNPQQESDEEVEVLRRSPISHLLGLPKMDKSKLFPSCMTSENPVLAYGLFDGQDCFDYMHLLFSNIRGSPADPDLKRRSDLCSSLYLDSIYVSAKSCSAGYCSQLSGQIGKTFGNIETKDKYKSNVSLLFSFLHYREILQLPPSSYVFKSEDEKNNLVTEILFSLLNLCVTKKGEKEFDDFIRFACLKSRSSYDEKGFSLVSIGVLSHLARDLNYLFKMTFQCMYQFEGLSSPDPRLSEEAFARVQRGKLTEPSCTSSVINLLSYCLKWMGSDPAYTVIYGPENDYKKRIFSCTVGTTTIDNREVCDIVQTAMEGAEALFKEFFSKCGDEIITKYDIVNLIGGKLCLVVSDNKDMNEATYHYYTESVTTTPSHMVTSTMLSDEVSLKLKALPSEDILEIQALYGRISNLIFTSNSLTNGARQREFSRVRRCNTDSSEGRSLFYQETEGLRSSCGIMNQAYVTRLKKKGAKVNHTMLSLLQPQVSMLILIFSCLREGVLSGFEHHDVFKSPAAKARFRSLLFVSPRSDNGMIDTTASSVFNTVVASVCATLRSRSEEKAGFIPFKCGCYRHFIASLLRFTIAYVVESNHIKEVAQEATAMNILGHNRATNDMYAQSHELSDDGESLVPDHMGQLSSSCVMHVTRLSFSLVCHWDNRVMNSKAGTCNQPTAVHASIGGALGLNVDDGYGPTFAAAKVWLEGHLNVLRAGLGVGPTTVVAWRVNQLDALAYLICDSLFPTASSRLLQIFTPMGGGKTMPIICFGLIQKFYVRPSMRKISLVVIPNVILVNECLLGFAKRGLTVVGGNNISYAKTLVEEKSPPNVIIGTPDSLFLARGGRLATLSCLVELGAINTLVFEECHLMHCSFRPIFTEVALALRHPVWKSLNKVFISATCPSDMWKWLVKEYQLEASLSNLHVIEEGEARQLLTQYSVHTLDSLEETIAEVASHAKRCVSEKVQLLILVLSMKHLDQFRNALSNVNGLVEGKDFVCNSSLERQRLGDDTVNRRNTAFVAGTMSVLISTQPLVGVDCTFCTKVDLVGSFSLCDAVQGSGRACRSLSTTSSVRFFSTPDSHWGLTLEEEQLASRRTDGLVHTSSLVSYKELFRGECLRQVMTRCSSLGGRGLDRPLLACSALVSAIPCSVCKEYSSSFAVDSESSPIRSPPLVQRGPRVTLSPANPSPFLDSKLHTMADIRDIVVADVADLFAMSACIVCSEIHGTVCDLLLTNSPTTLCNLCYSGSHEVINCSVKPNTYCSSICYNCYLPSCDTFHSESSNVLRLFPLSESLRVPCQNDGRALFLLTAVMFDPLLFSQFRRWLGLKYPLLQLPPSAMEVNEPKAKSAFAWYFQYQSTSCEKGHLPNYYLAFNFWFTAEIKKDFAIKNSSVVAYRSQVDKWVCVLCNELTFPSKAACYRCKYPSILCKQWRDNVL